MAYQDFGELQTSFLNRDYGSAATLVQAKAWINEAYRNVSRARRWSWLQSSAAIASVANVPTITPPVTLMWAGFMVPADANTPRVQFLDDQYPERRIDGFSTRTGPPRFVQTWGALWSFLPTPDRVYNWTLFFWQRTSVLINSSDVPLIPQDERDVLVYGALQRAAEMDRNPEMAAYYQAQYENQLSLMRQRDGIRTQQQALKVPMPRSYRGKFDR